MYGYDTNGTSITGLIPGYQQTIVGFTVYTGEHPKLKLVL
jgi:hypothetical protein